MSIKDKLSQIGRILDDSLNNPDVIDIDEEKDIEALRMTVKNLEHALVEIMGIVSEIYKELELTQDK